MDGGGQRFDERVERQIAENGWRTNREEVTQGIYCIAGLDPETSTRRFVLVVPSPSATVTGEDIEWLVRRAADVDADIVEVTTPGSFTDDAHRLAGEHEISILDPSNFQDTATNWNSPHSQEQPDTAQRHPQQEQSGRPSNREPTQQPPQHSRGQGHSQQPPRQQDRSRQQQPRQQGHPAQQPRRQQPRQETRGQQPPPDSGGRSTTAQPGAESPSALRTGLRPVGGLIYGVIAFVVSFVATTAYFFYRLDDITDGNIDRVLPGEPEALGWGFYNVHRTDITASAGGETIESINYFDLVDQLDPAVFYVVVAVVLLLAGYVVASRVPDTLSEQEAVLAGASLAVGYLPLLAAGTFLFEAEEAGVTAGPELGVTLVLWGLLYTVVCGGLGGYLSRLL